MTTNVHKGQIEIRKDRHGNDKYFATAITRETVEFWSREAATHWLWIWESIVECKLQRAGRQ